MRYPDAIEAIRGVLLSEWDSNIAPIVEENTDPPWPVDEAPQTWVGVDFQYVTSVIDEPNPRGSGLKGGQDHGLIFIHAVTPANSGQIAGPQLAWQFGHLIEMRKIGTVQVYSIDSAGSGKDGANFRTSISLLFVGTYSA